MVLAANALTCDRGGARLFTDLTWSICSGDIMQVVGPNGSGKSTLLSIIANLFQPRSGYMSWHGERLDSCLESYYRGLVFLGHRRGLKLELTVDENINNDLCWVSTQAQLDNALAICSLTDIRHKRLRLLSAGQRQRVSLARLWIADAKLWVLDEPFESLDHDMCVRVEHRMQEHLQSGGMIAFTSHQALVTGLNVTNVINLGVENAN